MKQLIYLLVCLFLIGCKPGLPPPDIDFGGLIKIKISGTEDQLDGIFQVNGIKNEFRVYFYDGFNIPRGTIEVVNGRIIKSTTQYDYEIVKLFKYWPILFMAGEDKKIEAKKTVVEYLSRKIFQDKNMPKEIKISNPDIELEIEIYYGN